MLNAQIVHFGAKAGVSFSFGLPVNRFGIEVAAFTRVGQVQLNGVLHGFYCLRSFGPLKNSLELQTSESLVFLFGPQTKFLSDLSFINVASRFGRNRYSIGYGLKQYVDQCHTSQHSAMVHFSLANMSVLIENDAFLFSANDKFRTGSIVLSYQSNEKSDHTFMRQALYLLKLQLYSPDILGKSVKRIRDDGYPSRHGYVEFTEDMKPLYSHGILSGGVELVMNYNQSISFQAGIDDERVRHVVQNKIIHDMPFLPLALDKAKNPHVPMLQANGNVYLFQKEQKIRPPKLFMQLGMNEAICY